MKCKYCQSEIDARAKVCPHCRRKQSNDGMIIFLVLLGSFLFLIIGIPFFVGFFSGVKGEPKTSVSVDAPQAAEQATEAEAVVIYDQGDVKISYLGIEQTERKAKINLLIENGSAENLMIQTNDFSVNSFMIEPFFSAHVASEKNAYDSLDIHTKDLEANKITEIKDIEFKFHIVNEKDWSTKKESDTIKITVN